jgi:hypothetical protein
MFRKTQLIRMLVVVVPIRVIPFRLYGLGLAVTAGWLLKDGNV